VQLCNSTLPPHGPLFNPAIEIGKFEWANIQWPNGKKFGRVCVVWVIKFGGVGRYGCVGLCPIQLPSLHRLLCELRVT